MWTQLVTIVVLFLSYGVNAILKGVDPPAVVPSGEPLEVTFTDDPQLGDPPFDLILTNGADDTFTLARSVPPEASSIIVTIPQACVPVSADAGSYYIDAVNITNAEIVYAQSNSFDIVAGPECE